MIRLLILFFLLASALSFSQEKDSSRFDVKKYLEELRMAGKSRMPFYTIVDPSPLGASEADIPILIDSLDSKDSCANVMSVLSSFIDFHKSTIGHESAYLIQGFRVKHYPPGLNSTRFRWNKEEILEWWKKYQQEKRK